MPVSRRPVNSALTWIAEKGVVRAGPVNERVPFPVRIGAGEEKARRVPTGPGPAFGFSVRGGSVWWRASSTTATAVTARAARAPLNTRTSR